MVFIGIVRLNPVYFKRETFFQFFEGKKGLRADSTYTAAVMRSDSEKKIRLSVWRQQARRRRNRKLLLPAICRNETGVK